MIAPAILHPVRTAIALALPVVVALSSCTSFEPEAGPQRACMMAGSGGYGGGSNSYSYTTPYPLYGGKDPRCQPDGGWDKGDCDACENQFCCQFRFNCYADGPCWCADKALDVCLNAIPPGDDGGGDGSDASSPTVSPAVQQCWLNFESTDVAALVRVNCQRAYCQTQCGVP
jgi:hypothetical protein